MIMWFLCSYERAWRLLLLPSIIGERAPALLTNVDVGLVPAALQRVVGLSRLGRSLGIGEVERSRGLAVSACSGRTVASASVTRRLSEKKAVAFLRHTPPGPARHRARAHRPGRSSLLTADLSSSEKWSKDAAKARAEPRHRTARSLL